MRRIGRPLVSGFLVALLAACGSSASRPTTSQGTATAPPMGSARVERSKVELAVPVCSDDPAAKRVLDRMPHNDLGHNALKEEALKANEALRVKLGQMPLNDASLAELGGDDAWKMHEPETRDLLKYIVSCALLPEQRVHDAHADGGSWEGELGLYSQWSTTPPSADYQELVSACVLARVNALHKRVPISLRGAPECLLPLREKVPVETTFRENDGKEGICSFNPQCTERPKDPATRNCGWQPLYVGRCLGGTQVTVTAGDSNQMLRVCEGLYGCDTPKLPTDLPRGAEQQEEQRARTRYSKWLRNSELHDDGRVKRHVVTFTCPSNGPSVRTSRLGASALLTTSPLGYFSLMSAPTDLSAAAPPSPAPPTVSAPPSTFFRDDGSPEEATKYPAAEGDVFTVQEGAFYGNIFVSALFKSTATAGSGSGMNPKLQHPSLVMLSDNTFACYSSQMNDGLASLTDRLCSEATSCFAHIPGPCSGQDARCARDGNFLDFYHYYGAYADCAGEDGARRWKFPITTYLSDRCDLSRDTCYGRPAAPVPNPGHLPAQGITPINAGH